MASKVAGSARWVAGLTWALLGVVGADAVGADRPSAARLLPDKTVLLVSIPDTRDLYNRWLKTSLGRMSQDPQVQPLLKHFYGSLSEAAAGIRDQLGLGLPELLALPQGEVAFALVALDEEPLAPVFLLEAGDQAANLRKLLERGTQAMETAGARKSEETVGGTKLAVYDGVGPQRRRVAYFERGGTLVAGTSAEALKRILAAWNGEKQKTLSENRKFTETTDRCHGGKGEQPQVTVYADPIGLVRAAGQGNAGIQVGLAILPTLGLDGLSAAGASMAFDTEQFDSVVHAYVLLERPRGGVLEMIALESGDTKPEPWVPGDVLNYTTLHWRFDKTYKSLVKLVDSFQGEGAFEREVGRRVRERTGVDFTKEVLPFLDGRVTHLNWIERPITATSRATLVALRLKDPAPVAKAVEAAYKKNESSLSRRALSTRQYYQFGADSTAPAPAPPPGTSPPPRPRPCFGVLDNWLVFTDRQSLYEKVIATADSPADNLEKAVDFQVVASRIARRAGKTKPAMISFSRPEETLRFLYELAGAEQTRQRLRERAGSNLLLRSLNSTLEANPLPPFAVLEKYFAPSGAMLIDDEAGLHYLSFSLRRK